MAKSLFPEGMINKSNGGELTLESIASKLITFELQLQLAHWQTMSFAEHKATGGFYEYLQGFRDGVTEKLMGYTGRRVTNIVVGTISSPSALNTLMEVSSFASSLKLYGESNSFHDICNMADELSGEAAKTKYLLTLS